MNPGLAKAALILSYAVLLAIRAPRRWKSRTVAIADDRKGILERLLLAGTWIGFTTPVVWASTRLLRFADYPLHALPFVLGVACAASGLWIFRRSHADLGTNWSTTLQVRATHTLVDGGIYRRLRHPMYAGLLLFALGIALFLPNRIAGISGLASMALLVGCRLGPEERMMRDTFGASYEAYALRTKRLIPGVF